MVRIGFLPVAKDPHHVDLEQRSEECSVCPNCDQGQRELDALQRKLEDLKLKVRRIEGQGDQFHLEMMARLKILDAEQNEVLRDLSETQKGLKELILKDNVLLFANGGTYAGVAAEAEETESQRAALTPPVEDTSSDA